MAEMTVIPVATHGFFLDGKWLEEGDIVDVRAPYDGALIAHVYQGRREHADAAIAAAVKAFGTTRRLPAFERQRVLRQIAAGIHDRKEEFSRTIALEAGKPIKSARTEVDRAVFIFNIAAEETVRGYGEYLPLDWQQSTPGRWGIVKRFPLGPLAGITPFNFPLNLVAHKVAPAIAAGCSMVLKPAPQTPLTALLLAEVIQQAGWPDGGFNAVLLSNEDSGLLVTDERIKLISFTGSAAVGWGIKDNAGKKRWFSSWKGIRASSSTAIPISPTPPTAASPEALLTPDSPAFPCSAFWSSTPSTEGSPSCCWRESAN